jgi:hypothetical protein
MKDDRIYLKHEQDVPHLKLACERALQSLEDPDQASGPAD